MNAPLAAIEEARDRLYALLPAQVRLYDAVQGYPLKALIAVLSTGTAELDGEFDTLLDSFFVETAPEGGLADLAGLVAAEQLQPLPPGSDFNTRAYVANTLRYRRGKGTARVLELLATDATQFGAIAVEYFMRLARLQNLIDVRPERPATAGFAAPDAASLTATAFDRFPRLVDVRSIARAGGRHNVPNVGLHILRPQVLTFDAVDADEPAPSILAGAPSARSWPDLGGNDRVGYFQLAGQPREALRLFNPSRREDNSNARPSQTTLADRLRRLPLHLETEALRLKSRPGLPDLPIDGWFGPLTPFVVFVRRGNEPLFRRLPPDELLIANFETDPPDRPASLKTYSWFENGQSGADQRQCTISCAVDPVTGRLVAAKAASSAAEITEVRVAFTYGLASEIGAGPQDRNDSDVPFDITDTPELHHFVRIVDSTAAETGTANDMVRQVQLLATALAEWKSIGLPTRGLIVLVRCDREAVQSPATRFDVAVPGGCELHIVSGEWREPQTGSQLQGNSERLGYVVRKGLRFTIEGRLHLTASPIPNQDPGVVVLDGLEVTAGITFTGDCLSKLWIRYCTLRRPGDAALATITTAMAGAEVVITRSIVGRVRLDLGPDLGTGTLQLEDSIVASDGAAQGAASCTGIDTSLTAVTLLGTSTFKSLQATNAIFAQPCIVARTQDGCIRYSWVADGSQMPRRFRCQPDLAIAAAADRKGAPLSPAEVASISAGAAPIFLDTALNEPTVAMLDPLTGDAVALGGENDVEMGAFARAAQRLRERNIESLFDDYVPFGLEAGLIDDTRSTYVAQRRNRP